MKTEYWSKGQQRAEAILALRKSEGYDALALRIQSLKPVQLSEEIISTNPKVTVSSWGQRETSDRLAVLSETRMANTWLRIIISNTVVANGFFIDPSGAITTMTEKDLWAHGY